MYFGAGVVVSFDGEHWKSHSAGRARGEIRGLAFDHRGTLWAAGIGDLGYFPRGVHGIGEFVSLREELAAVEQNFAPFWDVACTAEGVFFATDEKIYRWDGSKFEIYSFPGGRRLRLLNLRDRVHVSSVRTFSRFVGGRWEEVFPIRQEYGAVEWAEQGIDGLNFVTNKGIFRYANGRVEIVGNRAQGLISAVARIDHETLAIGLVNRGLAIIGHDGNKLTLLTHADGLPNSAFYSLVVDRDQQLWVTTQTSISRINTSTLATIFGSAHGLESGAILALENFHGQILARTETGAFQYSPETASFRKLDGLPSNIQALRAATNGRVLVSVMGRVYLGMPGEMKVVHQDRRDVLAVTRSRIFPERFFLMNTETIGILEADTSYFELEEGPGRPWGLAEDGEGNIWLGSSEGGVTKYARTETGYRMVSPPRPWLPPGRTVNLTAVGSTVAALSEGESHALDLDSQTFVPIASLAGYSLVRVTKQEAEAVAWAVFQRQINNKLHHPVLVRLSSPKSTDLPNCDFFDVPELARIGTILTIARIPHPTNPCLWIGGAKGLLRIELNRLQPAVPPREPLISATYRRDLATDPPDGPLTLPFKANQFTFEYAVTDFARRDQLLFQTRLVGLESEWSAPTALSRKEFPFLQEGDYRFEVRSLSPAGLTSAPVGWDFRVLPPWWRTRWAYAGYLVATGLLLFGADRVRVRAMRRRTEWLEEQVKARTAELEKANAAKTEFIARVNHDIRNPINGVLGLTLTLEQTRLTDDQKRITGTIRQCAKFLASLVEEVLDFAEIEAGGLKIKSEPFSLREAIDASIATIDPLARNAGSAIALEYDDALPARLGGDTARIQQVLVNFLSNAAKFGAGEPIVVTARPLHQVGPNLVVRLGVRDHGPGLPPDEQQQLFRKFSRGKLAEERKIKGTGLGLAVCRLLAERMGGRVGVESRPGEGAEFFLEVPLQLVGDEAAVEASVVAGNARVLVVEDEDYNAISLLAMLQAMGFKAERVADGIDALAALRRERFDVVFLDWELPGLNGIEVARRFRAEEPPDRRTLIIATTAYASADKRDACRAAGMDEFVAKPLTPDRITIAIRGHAGVLTPSSSILVRDEGGPDTPGVDLSLFSYLADNAAGIEAKVAEFIESCERELSEIDAFSAGGRGDDLRRAAHRFLSQCRFIGATRLAGLAVELEQRSEAANSPEVRKLIDALLAEFEAFRNELRSSLDARAGAGSGPSRSQSG